MPRRRSRRPARIASVLGVVILVLGIWYVWRQLPVRAPSTRTPVATVAPQDDLKREVARAPLGARAKAVTPPLATGAGWSATAAAEPSTGAL